MKHKNDYSVIVFFENITPKRWTFVHTIDSFVDLLNREHSGWEYMNVYERRTRKFLKRIYKGGLIPKFL